MENKDLGGWLVLNGNSASSYIITAFDNFEDSLHVYYLILPPLSIQLSAPPQTPRHAAKEHFPCIAKTEAGFLHQTVLCDSGLLITNNTRPSFMSKADGIYMFLGGSWIRAAL